MTISVSSRRIFFEIHQLEHMELVHYAHPALPPRLDPVKTEWAHFHDGGTVFRKAISGGLRDVCRNEDNHRY